MAKRKKSKKPNIPQETLTRARQQASGDLPDEPTAEDEVPTSPAPKVAMPTADDLPAPRRKPAITPAQLKKNGKQKDKPLTGEMIANLLANPTKVVTEEELHAEYGFVLADLRSMGLLAAGLMVLLFVLAQIL